MADTTRDFSLTRNEIIERALSICGVLEDGETVDGAMLVKTNKALNTLVKSWQTKGVFLWTLQEETVATVVDQDSYLLDEDVIGLDYAYFVENDNDLDIKIIPWREYKRIVHKSSSSNHPTDIALGPEKTAPTLYIYPTPAEVLTIHLVVVRPLQDMDNASDSADIPQRFLKALIYGLAADICDDYGVPLRERQYLADKAEITFRQAKRSDREWYDEKTIVSAYPTFRRR